MPGTVDVAINGVVAELELTQTTARNHIRDVLRRLDCHSQLEAVVRARLCRLL